MEKRLAEAQTSGAKTLSGSRGTAPTQAKRGLEWAALQHSHSKISQRTRNLEWGTRQSGNLRVCDPTASQLLASLGKAGGPPLHVLFFLEDACYEFGCERDRSPWGEDIYAKDGVPGNREGKPCNISIHQYSSSPNTGKRGPGCHSIHTAEN